MEYSTTIQNTIQVCKVCSGIKIESLPYPGNWSIPICKCCKNLKEWDDRRMK